jgi:hypothetical protein
MSAPPIRPQDITASSVVRRRGDVDVEELDGEALVWDVSRETLHELSRTALLVWTWLDGEQSVGSLASDLADAFGVAVAEVEADVLDVVRTLGHRGLLVGVLSDAGSERAKVLGDDTAAADPITVVEPPPGGS